MVKIIETSVAKDKALRGLAISISLQDDETLESDFYEIKDALLNWQRTYGKSASSILIEYQIADSLRQELEDFWLAKLNNDHLIRKIFVGVDEVELCLMSPDGRNVRRIGFELGGK